MNPTELADYLIALTKSSINGEAAPLPPEDVDWDILYKVACSHKIATLLYFPISRLKTEYLSKVTSFKDFKESFKSDVFLDTQRICEASRLKDIFDKNNIDYVFLKGYVTKNLYPDTCMRAMSDMDILYRSDKTDAELTQILADAGYKYIHETPKDTTYFNDSCNVAIEMHRYLVDKGYEKEFQLFSDIWNRLKPIGNHEYIMSDEDFYLFHMIHLGKHLKHSGIGIIPFIDLWFFINSHPNLDRQVLTESLKKVGFDKLDANARLLISYWFYEDGKKYSDLITVPSSISTDKKDFLHSFEMYILSSGAYGTARQLEIHKVLNQRSHNDGNPTRFALLKRIFPGRKTISNYYGDAVNKYQFLLPFYWVKLNLERLFDKNRSLSEKKKLLDSITDEQLKSNEFILNNLFK